MGIPWRVTAIGGTFAGALAVIEVVIHGATGTFAILLFVAIIFWAASFAKDSALRDFLTWLGINVRG